MKESILALPGCESCKAVKKKTKGKIKIISVGSKKGFKLAEQMNVSRYPQCFTLTKKGKPKKCNTIKFLKKFGITIK